MKLTDEQLRRVRVQQVISAEGKANKETWKSCLFCWQVAGNYEEGAVKGLASDIGKSDDTVYDRAHAYEIFHDLCLFDNGRFRLFVFQARRAPYITWSHFRALWDIRKHTGASMPQILDLLMDIVQGEGSISSRNLSDHAKERYGLDRTWEYYTERAVSPIEKALSDPKLPQDVRMDMQDFRDKMLRRIRNPKTY